MTKIIILGILFVVMCTIPGVHATITFDTPWYNTSGDMLEHGDGYLQNPPNNTDGLVSYWSFEEQTGNTLYDVWTDNSNDGTFTNGVTGNWTASGKYGGAWTGDGVDDYVNCGNDASLIITGNSNRSGEAWIKLNSYTNYNTIFSYGVTTSSHMIQLHTLPWTGKLSLALYANDHNSNTVIPLNTWTHIAYNLYGTTTELYVNGDLVSIKTNHTAINTLSSNFFIGTRTYPTGTMYFNGYIDEVRIYNRALSNDEINQSMNNYHKGNAFLQTALLVDAGYGNVWKYYHVNGTDPSTNTSILIQGMVSNDGINYGWSNITTSSINVGTNFTAVLPTNQYRYLGSIKIQSFTTYLPETNIITGVTLTEAPKYQTPDPINLAYTTDDNYVNYTWAAGMGVITDSYNVSVNNSWTNGSANAYVNSYVGPHGYSEIIVYAYNSSYNGVLSIGSLTANVTISNHAPTIDGVYISPTNPAPTDNLVAHNNTAIDIDGDTITLYYKWYKNGIHQPALDNMSTVLFDNTTYYDSWIVGITPNDGYGNGLQVNSTPVIVNTIENQLNQIETKLDNIQSQIQLCVMLVMILLLITMMMMIKDKDE